MRLKPDLCFEHVNLDDRLDDAIFHHVAEHHRFDYDHYFATQRHQVQFDDQGWLDLLRIVPHPRYASGRLYQYHSISTG